MAAIHYLMLYFRQGVLIIRTVLMVDFVVALKWVNCLVASGKRVVR
jgi:hypothetical protein